MNKCLCPTPDYIQWKDGAGTHTQLLKGFGTVLHGKKATSNCERCGQGLCGDCVAWHIIKEQGVTVKGVRTTPHTAIPLCPTCAEEVTK